MDFGQPMATSDIALALRGQNGRFHVLTPGGDELLVTCKAGNTITSIEWVGNVGKDSLYATSNCFIIKKVGVPLTVAETPQPIRQAG